MKEYHRLVAEINLDAIGENIRNIRTQIEPKTQLLAIVKADAYGHGALEVSRVCLYNGANQLAVATCDEGVALRESSIQVPILILGNTVEAEMEAMIKNRLTQAVFDYDIAKKISETAQRLNMTALVHIKIDTGMHRIGFAPTEENLDEIDKIFELPNIEVTGIFTHFATADEKDKTYTREQFEKFKFMTDGVEARGHKGLIRHCANSGAILDMPELQMDMVRAGIAIYGMYPSDEVDHNSVKLTPAMEIKSCITYIKEIEAGTAVSYGGTFVADHTMKVATIPVGYGDGYVRSLSGKGDVLIHGKRAAILGRICMDQFMVDVTDIPDVQEDDEVTLLGSDGAECITMEELAEKSGGFHYEMICDIGKRIPRVYLKDGKVVGTKDYFDDVFKGFE